MWLSDGVISLCPIAVADAPAYCAVEPAATVDWLHGGELSLPGVTGHFEMCAAAWRDGGPQRVFAVTTQVEEDLLGVLGVHTGQPFLSAGQASVAYDLTPAWRRPTSATRAVVLGCRFLARTSLAEEAVLRVDPGDAAAVMVARRAGFHYFRSSDTEHEGRLDWYYQAV
ncbi:GNAT family N-acetyltransferase [Nocardia takedensis]